MGKVTLWDYAYLDSNTYKLWIANLFCLCIGYYLYDSLFLTILLNIIFFSVTDVIYYFFNLPYYDPSLNIARGYSVSVFLNDDPHSTGLDYGFNFYNGDYKKSRIQAQLDKFKYACDQIGIKQGMNVIDVGCGCGDWLNYLQNTMKCNVVGVNITEAQAKQVRSRGIKCYTTDWKLIRENSKLKSILYNKFDAVTFWDTVEHYVSSGEGFNKPWNRQKVYQHMFLLAKKLINDKSKLKKVWISCLHNRRHKYKKNLGWLWRLWYCYFLDKMHSGYYPTYCTEENGELYDELVDNASKMDVNLAWRKDVTYDYYMTSKLNPTHFGRHRFTWTFERIIGIFIGFFIDPYHLHRCCWWKMESWMDQFTDYETKTQKNNQQKMEKADMLLWWLLFNVKKA